MTTVVRTGMIEDGAFYTQAEAYALFRAPFIGSYVDLAYEPDPETHPELLPCYGQTVLVADYPELFTRLGTTYGGNGVTTFGIPDRRGRVLAGLDNMGGTSANRLTGLPGGLNGDTLGATGGAEKHSLSEAEMPTHGHIITVNPGGAHSHSIPRGDPGGGSPITVALGNGEIYADASTDAVSNHSHTASASTTGGSQAHNNVQPTIIGVVCIIAL